MNAARPNTMEILRPADVGAHCVRPLATEGLTEEECGRESDGLYVYQT